MINLIALFFSVWFIFTILWQFEICRKRLAIVRLFNTFNLLPIWTFFAPRPGISDTHLLFRDKGTQGNHSDWYEIEVFECRKGYHFLWNPLKRKNKLVVDALSQVKTYKRLQEEKNIDEETFELALKTSKGYLVLLTLVCGHQKLMPDSISRQFIIADTSFLNNTRHFKPLMASPFHLL